MSVFGVQVDARELQQALQDMGAAAADLSPIMAVIAEDLATAVSDMYDTEGNGAWPPHAASTLEKRRGGGRGARLLQDTGRLAASTEAEHGADYAEASTNTEYIVYHLEGGPVIPKRNPFELGDEVFDDATETLLGYLLEKLQ